MGRARNRGRAQKSLGSAHRNAGSQPDEDGSGVVDSSGAAGTRENPDSASRAAGGGYSSSNSEREDRTDCGPPGQLRSSGDPGSNLHDRQSLEDMEASGGMASATRAHDLNNHKGKALGRPGAPGTPDSEVHSHNDCSYRVVHRSPSSQTRHRVRTLADDGNENAGHSQTSFDAAPTGYADQKRNLDNRGRPTIEGESAVRSQNQSQDRNTFDHTAGYLMGGVGQITRDTSINASTRHHNTQGKFDCNSGSYNNYGDKDSKFVNKGMFVNKGNIEMNFPRADWEGLKNTGRYSIPHPTYLPSCPANVRKCSAAVPGEEGLGVPWMVTCCRNRGFTGREDILGMVERQAQAGGHNRVALWGLGGTGYCHTLLFSVEGGH